MIFPEKSLKGSRVPPQSLKKTPKWTPRVPKWSPEVSKFSPKATKSVENLQPVPQGSHNGAPGATMEPQGPHKCEKKTCETHPNCNKDIRRCPKVKRKIPYRHRQPSKKPTNQRNKEKHKETINRTNTHKSFELQTQTQTPAAGCSPKAT